LVKSLARFATSPRSAAFAARRPRQGTRRWSAETTSARRPTAAKTVIPVVKPLQSAAELLSLFAFELLPPRIVCFHRRVVLHQLVETDLRENAADASRPHQFANSLLREGLLPLGRALCFGLLVELVGNRRFNRLLCFGR